MTNPYPVLHLEHAWQLAYQWVCVRRRHYPANVDIWHLRFHWATQGPELLTTVLSGRYRLSPMQVLGKHAIWPTGDFHCTLTRPKFADWPRGAIGWVAGLAPRVWWVSPPRALQGYRTRSLRLYEQALRQGHSEEECQARVRIYRTRWRGTWGVLGVAALPRAPGPLSKQRHHEPTNQPTKKEHEQCLGTYPL